MSSSVKSKELSAGDKARNASRVIEEVRNLWDSESRNLLRARWETGRYASMLLGKSRDKNGEITEDRDASIWEYGAQSVETIAASIGHGFNYGKLNLCIKFWSLVSEKLLDRMLDSKNARGTQLFAWKSLTAIFGLPGRDTQLQCIESSIDQAAKLPSLSNVISKAKDKHGRSKASAGQVKRHKHSIKSGAKFSKLISRVDQSFELSAEAISAFSKLQADPDSKEFEDAKLIITTMHSNVIAVMKRMSELDKKIKLALGVRK